jgi:hypothetical protein
MMWRCVGETDVTGWEYGAQAVVSCLILLLIFGKDGLVKKRMVDEEHPSRELLLPNSGHPRQERSPKNRGSGSRRPV